MAWRGYLGSSRRLGVVSGGLTAAVTLYLDAHAPTRTMAKTSFRASTTVAATARARAEGLSAWRSRKDRGGGGSGLGCSCLGKSLLDDAGLLLREGSDSRQCSVADEGKDRVERLLVKVRAESSGASHEVNDVTNGKARDGGGSYLV